MFFSFFFDKWVKAVSGGFVIDGAYTVYFTTEGAISRGGGPTTDKCHHLSPNPHNINLFCLMWGIGQNFRFIALTTGNKDRNNISIFRRLW